MSHRLDENTVISTIPDIGNHPLTLKPGVIPLSIVYSLTH